MEIAIRIALQKDLSDIVEILNQAIRTQNLIAFTSEFTVEQRTQWFNEHSENSYPLLVAEYEGKVVGWTCLSPYRYGREALNKVVEVSYFVHKNFQRKGIGNKLLQSIIDSATGLGYSIIFAIIFDINTGSKQLLKKNNFEQWGILPEVAELNEKKISHVYYGKKL